MSAKNNTPFKSLNKIADHPMVDEIWDEGDDGIWLSLKYPYADPIEQIGTIHILDTSTPCKELKERFKIFLNNPWKYVKGDTHCVPADNQE